ncbi:hypothetical protein DB347_01315 [Opitutaceae bacterium EW11]|nr:hypothetical protein DB347_01315 [Opitutaceae bacterium EW11]
MLTHPSSSSAPQTSPTVLSRVANLIYWTARYLERAENTARIVDVNAQLVLDLHGQLADNPALWEPLVYVSGGEELYRQHHARSSSERSVIEFMLFDRRNPSSVISCICTARENARCIRDQLASELWEELNTFYLALKDDDFAKYSRTGASEYLGVIKTRIQQFCGVAEAMVPRNAMWWFFELGRFLERADNTSRILDVKYFMLLPKANAVGSALDMIQWASVLRSCSGLEAFRKSRRGQLNLERVVDYLLRDPVFPRSIVFSVREAGRALAAIDADAPNHPGKPAAALLSRLETSLAKGEISDIIIEGLHEHLDDIQLRIAEVHEAVQNAYIRYPTA